jgi:putative solute:sodium symporter small subunit
MTNSADTQAHNAETLYWQKNLRLTACLLLLWFVVTFGFGFWASELNFSLFGWPFSFWAAAQGALLVYCGIVWYYALAMDRLDGACGAAETH